MRWATAPSNMQEAFAEQRADYNAAKASQFQRRRTGISLSGSSADYHYRDESRFLLMLEFARDMDRNDMLVGQAIDRATGNIVRDGIFPDAKTGDSELDDLLEKRFEAWGADPEQCDITGEMTFSEMQYLAKRQHFVDGDIVALPAIDGQLQLVEAHRIRTPRNTSRNVVHGVLLDDQRKRLEYWFAKDDIDPNRQIIKVSEIEPVAVRDEDGNRQIFHLYDPKRATQTRGVTALAPIFDTAGMFEDINFARLIQQQVVSCFAFIRERTLEYEGDGTVPTMGPTRTEIRSDGSTNTVTGISPGMDVTSGPGETVTGFSPDIPSPQFFEHMRLVLTIIGINLGLPLVLLTLDASETNFSGFRGAVDQARIGFRRQQKLLIDRFCRPVYLWKIRQWLAEDPILRRMSAKPNVDIFAHEWKRPRWPYLEPRNDAEAQILRRKEGLSSPRRITAENEGDYYEITDELVFDNAYRIKKCKEAAVAINEEFDDGVPVTWRDVLDPTATDISIREDKSQEEETSAGQNPNRNPSQRPGQRAARRRCHASKTRPNGDGHMIRSLRDRLKGEIIG